jgi:hypothetical protein
VHQPGAPHAFLDFAGPADPVSPCRRASIEGRAPGTGHRIAGWIEDLEVWR